ncbi:MAG: hypothetical protein ACO1OK_00745 [Devosia sp.]
MITPIKVAMVVLSLSGLPHIENLYRKSVVIPTVERKLLERTDLRDELAAFDSAKFVDLRSDETSKYDCVKDDEFPYSARYCRAAVGAGGVERHVQYYVLLEAGKLDLFTRLLGEGEVEKIASVSFSYYRKSIDSEISLAPLTAEFGDRKQ